MQIPKYPKMMMALHWITVVLVFSAVVLILCRDVIEGKPLKLWLLNAHKALGLLIPFILFIRVIFLWVYRNELPVHPLDQVTKIAASIIHAIFYMSLFVIPLLGWLLVSAKGQVTNFLWTFPIPALIPEDIDLAEQYADWHEWAAYALLALVALHILAALWHHYFKKDNVLKAMAPIFK